RGADGLVTSAVPRVPGESPRRRIVPAGDSGPFVLMTWPSGEICEKLVEMTRAAGGRPGPDGVGNIRMTNWGLHIYYNNVSLVQKHGVNTAGRPWSDPLNEFATDYNSAKGALPQMDDLIERSILLTVSPALTVEPCARVSGIYQVGAPMLGLK